MSHGYIHSILTHAHARARMHMHVHLLPPWILTCMYTHTHLHTHTHTRMHARTYAYLLPMVIDIDGRVVGCMLVSNQ